MTADPPGPSAPPLPPAAGPSTGPLAGRHVTLCITGSIAAFKSPVIVRMLAKAGATVDVVLSRSALQFIGPATFSGMTGRPVLGDMFDPHVGGELHVEIGRRSDLMLIAPATADVLARLATGRADDTIAAAALCADCGVLIAPAMHPAMWAHPATQRNVETLRQDGRVAWIGPVRGEVATGEVGVGRMAEPEHVVGAAIQALSAADLTGRHVVVSAGPTLEDVDPVRFLGNRSSGKMGFALAERAAARGARVTLVSGPVHLPTPFGVDRVDVRSAESMSAAIQEALGADQSDADALLMAAAVADHRPAEPARAKLKRNRSASAIDLTQNPDILAEIGAARRAQRPVLVGFALETDTDEKVITLARDKLKRKRVDLVVANRAGEVLGRDENRATLVTQDSEQGLPVMPKHELADRILDWVATRLQEAP